MRRLAAADFEAVTDDFDEERLGGCAGWLAGSRGCRTDGEESDGEESEGKIEEADDVGDMWSGATPGTPSRVAPVTCSSDFIFRLPVLESSRVRMQPDGRERTVTRV